MSHSECLRDAIRAVTIDGDGSFYWFGDRSAPPDPPHRPKTSHHLRDDLRIRLQRRLYWNFYVLGKAASIVEREDAEEADEEAFVRELSAANCGRGVVERGWQVTCRNGATATVTRNGMTLRVATERIKKAGGGVTLRGLKELRGISPGFYTALGDVGLTPEPLLRIYWNVRPDGAVSFIRHATRIMNRAAVAFRAKVVSDPLSFDRCDSAVLYVLRRDLAKVYRCLRAIYRSMKDSLKEPTPAMTKHVGRGVAIAEDPPVDMSFGEHRCRAVAEALIQAHKKHETGYERRLAEVLAAFERNGISPSRPYLNARSSDVYELLEA